jgi:hypothetical protein
MERPMQYAFSVGQLVRVTKRVGGISKIVRVLSIADDGTVLYLIRNAQEAESIVRHHEIEKAYRRPRLVQAALDVSAAQVDQGSACYPTGTRDARRRLRPVGRGSLTGA